MEFTLPGGGPEYWYPRYVDEGLIRNYQTRLEHETTATDKEPCFAAFRHQPLPISNMDLNRSYNNEGSYFQGLAPSLTYPFHMEHSLGGQYSPPDWSLDYEVMRNLRYMSPNGPHGGSLSESSASSESACTPEAQPYPIRFSKGLVSVPGQYTFKALEYMPHDSTAWIPDPSNPYIQHGVALSSTYQHHSSSLSPKELEFSRTADLPPHESLNEGAVQIHQDSPMQRPEPEELDLTSINTESITSSLSQAHHSDSEQTEEEVSDTDSMAIDDDHNDSDPDYENRPRRRTNSRSTTGANKRTSHSLRSPRQARRTSNHNQPAVVDDKARVHKSGPSSNASSSTSAHARKASKSKTKAKKPDFVKKLEQNARQETMARTDRPFPCTFHHFGCISEFPNKNEWKRHVAYQHLQLGYYRCDLDGCRPENKPAVSTTDKRRTSSSRSSKGRNQKDEDAVEIKIYNDFNRKDLFTQHCRRMHGPTRNRSLCSNPPNKRGTLSPTKDDNDAFEDMLQEIRQRCWNVRRQAPARSTCGFCNRVFDADAYQNTHGDSDVRDEMSPSEKAWEARMEHIGKHYEKDKEAFKEFEDLDEDLKDWGVENGLLEILHDGRAWLVNAEVTPIVHPTETKASSGLSTKVARARHPRKAARRPSRTVEYCTKTKIEQIKTPIPKMEPHDSDDDAEGESDHAVS